MGQTLTHGVYLPDEGERNCYNGLASNWGILDGAVGTIAEHTTALAGKAPLVHTHSKSDVTDLFNSANTWGGENKYTSGFILSNISWSGVTPPSSAKPTVIEFKNADTRQGRYINRISSTSSETWIETIRNVDANTSYNHTVVFQVDNSGNKSVYPYSNNDIDLGIATHQWNNLYAKNYYYNGVAWGLDKANTWSQNQIIASGSDKCYYVKDMVYELGQTYSSGERLGGLVISDKNGSTVGLLDIVDRSYGHTEMRIRVQQKFDPDSNNRSTSGTTLFNELIIGIASDKTNYIGFNADLWGANHNLGISTNKWKTLNGVNPGALSLPSEDASSTNLDPTNWNTTGTQYNTYIPPSNGWLGIQVMSADTTDLTGQYLFAGRNTGGQDFWPQGQLVNLVGDFESNKLTGNIFFPVIANKQYQIRIKIGKTQTEGSIIRARFYPCLGNV